MSDSAEFAAASAAPTPSIPRRLAAFLYEGVLLFGVLMVAGLLYSVATQMRHALQGLLGLQLFVFAVLALYFTVFWSRSGQTVAMQAWHVRLVNKAGQPVSRLRAFMRYLLAWLWFVPALAVLWLSGLKNNAAAMFSLISVGVLTYALLARLHPDRQFLHDALCGTRLITWRPARKKKA